MHLLSALRFEALCMLLSFLKAMVLGKDAAGLFAELIDTESTIKTVQAC